MPIEVRLDLMLAHRKVKSKDLAAYAGITEANLSLLKHGKVKGVRFGTLARICAYLDCQPGDLLVYLPDNGVGKEEQADKETMEEQSCDL
ncbi:helix-turn-helix domain-containing protein [Algihabitans sp.]|uniref:helix-turn-helix domain-containing protein n=1 Tax=Algihabitans sp. TaxID=2821514 RepID=UPI003BAC853B